MITQFKPSQSEPHHMSVTIYIYIYIWTGRRKWPHHAAVDLILKRKIVFSCVIHSNPLPSLEMLYKSSPMLVITEINHGYSERGNLQLGDSWASSLTQNPVAISMLGNNLIRLAPPLPQILVIVEIIHILMQGTIEMNSIPPTIRIWSSNSSPSHLPRS